MKFSHLVATVAVCVISRLSAADLPTVSAASEFDTTSLSEPGKMPDVSLLPTLPAVTSEGMPSLVSGLSSPATRVPESAVAGFVALFGYILILRRRTV